jgi:hypothetical protein
LNHSNLVNHSHALSGWVTKTIQATSEQQLSPKLDILLSVMEELYKLNNFNGLASIWRGLTEIGTANAKKYSFQTSKIFKKATELFSKKNYEVYRKELKSCGVPCVPLGLVIEADILEQMEGKEPIAKWNFVDVERCRILEEIVENVKELQITYSTLKQIPTLIEWIENTIKIDQVSDVKQTFCEIALNRPVGFLSFVDVRRNETRPNRSSLSLKPVERMKFEDMVRFGAVVMKFFNLNVSLV